ncbi:hypothetical protein FS842_003826 [Serendipita sp. 407]|nr:hypothetical protein FRC20_005561 [Serendipita sp. 405]KAG9054896.1 hypothetical protein FS842_003826 [Serendipita sp. 407]
MTSIVELASTPIMEHLDESKTREILSNLPFIAVPGVVNFRDVGGLPITHIQQAHGIVASDDTKDQVDTATKRLVVKSGRLFRSAQLNALTPQGVEKLHALNIGAIFDFRTTVEVRRYGKVPKDDTNPRSGLPLFLETLESGEGIQVNHNPLKDITNLSNEQWMAKLLIYGKGDEGFAQSYDEMLESGGKSFGNVLRYIFEQATLGEEQEGKACLWHCHVGKDRTGVFSALLLSLLGVSDEVIAKDYSLTRIGLEPLREELLENFKGLMATHPQVAIGLASSNASAMLKFLDLLRTKYGGPRAYFIQYSGFTDEELDLLCEKLVTEEML